MIVTKDHIGGLVFLCLSVAYGYYARTIPMFPGDEYEPFNAQTLPIALSWMGGILAILMLATARRDAASKLSVAGLDFLLVAKLLALIVAFAFALEWVGFTLSTIFFLIGGYWVLGERRPKMLFIASVPFAVGIWFVLAKLLDIYLAPGRFFTQILGG
ncbi:tripartite tricarboxylate transporter TctB family protein [Enterovibrio nigricans]|uniref:Putative tricarboxylic transport membrane protein n=1 Tax=Enterovibrio nigricans DSM 22720 TaxID=1121868 RepID=A0A1T4VUH1_9GAMM|nr:tripartite tricarboxylate transporter TctB family protein [Enterovibrio nigricans]PKF49407.1 tripartite tricarboxylate transporter TctB family protein [Enterovibrio nigricans]SKA68632.1 putative tricarboxylic transport membrane protein [Enterovibrio nigricans DSM 22720]